MSIHQNLGADFCAPKSGLGKNLGKFKLDVHPNLSILQKSFYENHMILSPGKCHDTLLGAHIHIDYITLKLKVVETKHY